MDPFTWFQRWFHRFLHQDRIYSVETCEDMPDTVRADVLYLVGEAKHPWAAALLCPCGCAQTISLSLIRDDSPSWSVRRHRDGSASLFPSVWRTKGCRSHFFLRNNRIVWARETRSRRSQSIKNQE